MKPLLDLSAEDLMSRDVVQLREQMPLREAARLLLHHQISGAPVVDADGRCVGVLSARDILRLAERRSDITRLVAPRLPVTCSFQKMHCRRDGSEATLCTLPAGACPIQVRERDGPGGAELLVCSQPHCVLMDWQMVDLEKLPGDEVRHFMTPDPVTVQPAVAIADLAQIMVDAHIHRVVVVDEASRPIGTVSATDLMAALARAAPPGADSDIGTPA